MGNCCCWSYQDITPPPPPPPQQQQHYPQQYQQHPLQHPAQSQPLSQPSPQQASVPRYRQPPSQQLQASPVQPQQQSQFQHQYYPQQPPQQLPSYQQQSQPVQTPKQSQFLQQPSTQQLRPHQQSYPQSTYQPQSQPQPQLQPQPRPQQPQSQQSPPQLSPQQIQANQPAQLSLPSIKDATQRRRGTSQPDATQENYHIHSLQPQTYAIKHGDEGAIYAGFDFGTVYSTIGVWKEGKVNLADLQGAYRVMSLVEANERKTTYAKDAMQLLAPRGKSVLFALKLRLYEGKQLGNKEQFLVKFFGFMKDLAIAQAETTNAAVVCLPGGFKGEVVENLKRILQPQFQSTTFISDIAAIFVCYMYERQIQLGTAPCEYVVISWGGAFFTCGRVKQRDSRITVGKVHCRSDLGGEQLVATMMVIVLRKVGLTLSAVKAPGRFWYQCMTKMESLHEAGSIELEDLPILLEGCEEESVVVTWDEFWSALGGIEVIKQAVIKTIGQDSNIQILISGGLCRFPPFRTWLEDSYPKRVAETFNMSTACAVGATVIAGVLNNRPTTGAFTLSDVNGFGW